LGKKEDAAIEGNGKEKKRMDGKTCETGRWETG